MINGHSTRGHKPTITAQSFRSKIRKTSNRLKQITSVWNIGIMIHVVQWIWLPMKRNAYSFFILLRTLSMFLNVQIFFQILLIDCVIQVVYYRMPAPALTSNKYKIMSSGMLSFSNAIYFYHGINCVTSHRNFISTKCIFVENMYISGK